jgi:hypothetical protein
VTVRRVRIETGSEHDDLSQVVCSMLRRRERIVAVPAPGATGEVLILGEGSIPRSVNGADFRATLHDPRTTEVLDCAIQDDQRILAELVEKAIVREFETAGHYWRVHSSARFWYDDSPRTIVDGIEVIPRLSFSVLPLSAGKFGVAIDVGSLFRGAWTVADFFDSSLSDNERDRRQRRFQRLRGRGEGRKGTLLYDTGESMVNTCYFDRFAEDTSCGSVPGFNGAKSLFDYCRRKYPKQPLSANDSVAFVRFKGLRRAVPVPAKWLRLRISLGREQMPKAIRQAVAASPSIRKQACVSLWERFGSAVLASIGFCDQRTLWRPLAHEREQLACPTLLFGQGRTVLPPAKKTESEYRRYFHERSEKLKAGGVFRFEPYRDRTIHMVTPSWDDGLERFFAKSFQDRLCDYTGLPFQIQSVRADTPEEAVERLNAMRPGTAIIVFDPRSTDQAAYSLLSYELRGWTIKRLTRQTVESRWSDLTMAGRTEDRRKAERNWNSVIELSALDVLDQMDATLWRVDQFGYDACLCIDVGQERRHFALSLLVCRETDCDTPLLRLTRHWLKADHQHESINPVVLAKSVEDLLTSFGMRPFKPMESVLVLRDGHECGDELSGLSKGLETWKRTGVLQQSAKIDVVDVHKHSMRGIRFWRPDGPSALNVIEGQAIYPSNQVAYVCCTGAATLSPGMTADPCVLVARGDADVKRATRAYFGLAQLNFSTPSRAHRLAQPLREVDAILTDCQMRNMRGVR